jgi:hypothetical protein
MFNVPTLIALGVALLISAAAFLVMRLYMRTIFRQSQRSASSPQDGPGVEHVPRGAAVDNGPAGNPDREVSRAY